MSCRPHGCLSFAAAFQNRRHTPSEDRQTEHWQVHGAFAREFFPGHPHLYDIKGSIRIQAPSWTLVSDCPKELMGPAIGVACAHAPVKRAHFRGHGCARESGGLGLVSCTIMAAILSHQPAFWMPRVLEWQWCNDPSVSAQAQTASGCFRSIMKSSQGRYKSVAVIVLLKTYKISYYSIYKSGFPLIGKPQGIKFLGGLQPCCVSD